ncbi:hypothetical protein LguiB_004387 [Lonicera macranthoides]
MAPQRHILRLTIIIISFVTFHTSLPNELPHNNYNELEEEDEYGGYDDDRLEPYSSRTENGQISNSAKLENGICLNKCGGVFDDETISVDDFGAKGDGKADDTQAFRKAWKKACSTKGATFVVPKGKTYLLKPITFEGPCKSKLIFKIYGRIVASGDRSDYNKDRTKWLRFDSVNNLQVEGGGVINGNGNVWWKHSCKINKSLICANAPTALHFYKNKKLSVKNLKIEDAPQIQVSFQSSENVIASNLKVTAPESSPNTDGIHVTHTKDINLSNIDIGTGDDCISIVSGSQKVRATNITCGPGHGISIGSLGSGKSTANVSDVTVNGAKFSGTSNGVRIKTYQGGRGSASNIKFQNVEMHNVKNPIIIDQHYCDLPTPCKEQSSAVHIENVKYQSISGTSASEKALLFDCSKSVPCQGIVVQDINLVRENGEDAKAVCNNVIYKEVGVVRPHCPRDEGILHDEL